MMRRILVPGFFATAQSEYSMNSALDILLLNPLLRAALSALPLLNSQSHHG